MNLITVVIQQHTRLQQQHAHQWVTTNTSRKRGTRAGSLWVIQITGFKHHQLVQTRGSFIVCSKSGCVECEKPYV